MTTIRQSRMPPYSVLMYAGDIQGLGHVRRSTIIASRLVRELPGTRVLIFTGLPSGCFFELPRGVDFIKLPAVSKIDTGRYAPRTLTMSQDDLIRLRATIMREASQVFRPDLVLVDHMPAGLAGELLPTLRALKSRPVPAMTVLGLRDILDEPRVVRDTWRKQKVYDTINELYDAVFIYGSEDVFDARFQYHLDRYVSTDVSYCGYLRPERGTGTDRTVRRELGLDDDPLIVVTAGGGADGYPMMERCLESLRRLDPRNPFQVVCVTGPFMNREQRNALRRRSVDLPVRLLWCVDEGRPYLHVADLVVTMAGYNTLLEAICLGRRVLAMPRSGPSAEQGIRSRLFSELGLIRNVGIGVPSPDELARMIREALETVPRPTKLPSMNGVETVVERMKRLLAGYGGLEAPRSAVGQG